jgi:flagellin
MSDITLSAGIRQNLASLQQTSADLTTTQEALATGKAVNSAADNPSAYFTSQSLTNNANELSALLDQIGQSSQTIDAANNGLTGITSLLQQALSTAQQAQQASTGTVSYTATTGTGTIGADSTQATAASAFSASGLTASTQSSVTISSGQLASLANDDTLTFALNGTTVTATYTTATTGLTGQEFNTNAQLGTLLTTGFTGANTGVTVGTTGGGVQLTSDDVVSNFTVGGTGSADTTETNATQGSTLTVTNSAGNTSTFYYVASGANASYNTFTTDAGLASAIDSSTNNIHSTVNATDNGGVLTVANAGGTTGSITVGGTIGAALGFNTTAYDNNYNASLAAITAGSTLTIQVGSDATHTLTFGTGAGEISTLAGLNTQLAGFSDITASINGSGKLVLTPTSTDTITIGGSTSALNAFGVGTGTTTPTATVVTANSTRATLQDNYNGLLTQINQLAGDSSYNGVNLLTGNNLVVDFNQAGTSSLTISGVSDDATGLGLSTLSNSEFQDNNQIATVISNLNAAISSVQAQTETFGTNSSTISTRQTFETNMINTLQTGASNLVAADQNQESADLLTEQTQQQLEISALSIANQANQSVLKLFS